MTVEAKRINRLGNHLAINPIINISNLGYRSSNDFK